eukprot:COSAG01_NODE_1137_length_11546_cov_14.463091_12_plen_169_part_00
MLAGRRCCPQWTERDTEQAARTYRVCVLGARQGRSRHLPAPAPMGRGNSRRQKKKRDAKARRAGAVALMLETSMPSNEWLVVLQSYIWLTGRLARKKDVRSRDGDAPRALTAMSRGRISHVTLDHELKGYPGPPGTICVLTNSKIIVGSGPADLARKLLVRRLRTKFS